MTSYKLETVRLWDEMSFPTLEPVEGEIKGGIYCEVVWKSEYVYIRAVLSHNLHMWTEKKQVYRQVLSSCV